MKYFLWILFISLFLYNSILIAGFEYQTPDQYIVYLESQKNKIKKYMYGVYVVAGISFICAEALGPHGRVLSKKCVRAFRLIDKLLNDHSSFKNIFIECTDYDIMFFIIKCFGGH